MNISDKIKKLRTEKGMTLEELAQSIGTSKQTVHKYESGIIVEIPKNKIESLARALNTTPTFLVGWDISPSTAISTEQALQALLILERYAYTNRSRPQIPLKEKEYALLLKDIVAVINSKADQVYLEQQEKNAPSK